MQARLVAYVPGGAAIARLVAPGERLRIGRADDADLRLPHPSVSRRHAELQPSTGDGLGWTLADAGSKNGTFLDGARVSQIRLARGAWLRFGDVHCEFALLDADAASAQARRWQERGAEAARLVDRFDAEARTCAPSTLFGRVLRGVLELAQCTRGFVLTVEGGEHRFVASLALDASLASGTEFTGSLGAVAQALRTRAPVVFNDLGQDAWQAPRPSLAHGSLRTLVALPLLDGARAIGAIYVDRRDAGPPLTSLDVELLQGIAARCSAWLATQRVAVGERATAVSGPSPSA